jgi:protein-tyrosine phosphatase
MKEKLKKFGVEAIVDSAGTAAYHEGERPDSRSEEVALKNGIDIRYQRARRFLTSDFDKFDLIFAMDRSNYNDILRMARSPEHESKVKLILQDTMPNGRLEVPDPYYGGSNGFEAVFEMLDTACEKVAIELLPKK